jgi:hypothetical protein
MIVFIVLAVALLVALFAWAPWDDDDAGTNAPGTEQGADSDVDIEGDIDVTDEGDGGSDGGQSSPSQ